MARSSPPSRLRRVLVAGTVAVGVLGVTTSGAAAQTCDDPVVVHRPDGSAGDEDAVTVTSQVLERGVPGWSSVGWDPGDTDVTAIAVTTPAGVRTLPGDATRTDGPVLEVAFCTAASAPADASTAATDDAVEPIVLAGATTAPSPGVTGTTGRTFGVTLGAGVGAILLLLARGARLDREVAR